MPFLLPHLALGGSFDQAHDLTFCLTHAGTLTIMSDHYHAGMPAESSANIIPTLATQAKVKIYKNAAHGLYLTHVDQVLEDIFAVVFGK